MARGARTTHKPSKKPLSTPKGKAADDARETGPVPAAWLRRLVTEEGERLPVRDLSSRSRRSRPVGQILEPATRRLLGRRGLALGTMLSHWDAIVGQTVARHCVPLKLVMPRKGTATSLGGVLHIKAASGAIATDLMHRSPLICERINGTLGYRAVARLQIAQGPLSGRVGRARARGAALPPAPEHLAALENRLATVEDPDLRAALERLGKAVLTPRR